MIKFIEKTGNNRNEQNHIELIFDMSSKESYKIQSQRSQKALVQKRIFGEAVVLL